MKCIINCPEKSALWTQEFFPELDPYLLKFANKPYLEYLIDFCILNGISEIRIVSDNPTLELHEFLSDGKQYGVNFSFATGTPEGTFRNLIDKNSSFCSGDSLLILSGFFWINYHKNKLTPFTVDDNDVRGNMIADDEGWILLGRNRVANFNGEFTGDPSYHCDKVDSILAFYEKSMHIVYAAENAYNLPGYGDRTNYVIGRNVVIPPGAAIHTPVVFGNSIQLGNNTNIGPGVIIGDNVLIDENSTVADSIIMGNSYVGCHSELKSKIVYRNHVIDPKLGISLDIIDEFLLTELVKQGYWSCPLKQRISAAILMLLMTIPFCILRPFLVVRAVLTECYMNQQRKAKLALYLYLVPENSIQGKLFRKLSLDRYHLLPLVLKGKLRLIGSKVLKATPENARLLSQFPDYAPGIFSYSEYLGSEKDKFQMEIDELYYMHHASFKLNLKIFCGIWFRNFMKAT